MHCERRSPGRLYPIGSCRRAGLLARIKVARLDFSIPIHKHVRRKRGGAGPLQRVSVRPSRMSSPSPTQFACSPRNQPLTSNFGNFPPRFCSCTSPRPRLLKERLDQRKSSVSPSPPKERATGDLRRGSDPRVLLCVFGEAQRAASASGKVAKCGLEAREVPTPKALIAAPLFGSGRQFRRTGRPRRLRLLPPAV